MTQLSEGAALPVPAQALQVAVTWQTVPGAPEVDVSALLLDGGGRVRGDSDLVFYNHTEHPSGAVRHLGKSAPGAPGSAAADWLWLHLARMEREVDRVVVAASVDGGSFGQVRGLDVRVTDLSGAPVSYFAIGGATTETAFVFGEFRRREGGWTFRAVGRGYGSGLAGLATDFGIVVEPPPAPIPGPGYVPPPAPRQAPGYGTPPTPVHSQTYGTPPTPVHSQTYGTPPTPRPAPGYETAALPVPSHGHVAPAVFDPLSSSFRPSVHQGRGKETVHCDPAIPPGWALLEIESYHSISTTIESCDAHGRAEDFLLMAYEDDVRARTVALVPPDRPLTLRVDADTPWTLRVLPLAHARRFDSHIEGHAHDLVVYDGPPGVLDFSHHGASPFTVHQHTPPREPEYDAEDQELLVDEIGEVRVSAPVTGPGLLRISGDGPWKCAMRR
ncbi:TerD family protein [Streptomyces sp. NPDC012508]|uniref:TerD family protein n=1 Tax=Streptomyces sp. NPDC012508 TaxID=3364837 RepID=UPI0036A7EDE3